MVTVDFRICARISSRGESMSNTQPSLPTPQPSDYTQPRFQASQPYYANPQTYYPPQVPMPGPPPSQRTMGDWKRAILAGIIVLLVAGGIVALYSASHLVP